MSNQHISLKIYYVKSKVGNCKCYDQYINPEFIDAAVKKVFIKMHSNLTLAKKLDISIGLIQTCFSKLKKADEPHTNSLKFIQSVMAMIKAEFSRINEERKSLKKSPLICL